MPRVPSRSHYDAVLDCWMHTGENALDAASRFRSGHLATDIETPGLDRAFEINCVTFAWTEQEKTHTILLDPAREESHAQVCRDLYRGASMIILHNAPFDVPALHHHDLLTIDQISKVVDTLVLARYGWPDQMVRKGLGELAKRHLGMDDNAEGMKLAFKAAGYRTIAEGYEKMDIDSAIYRQGAMLDTVATLRLQPILREHCWEWSLNHPFETYGATNFAEAEALLETQEMVHRRMLKQTARGIPVDLNYLDEYAEKVSKEKLMAEAELAVHGLEGGMGKGAALVRYLDEIGELPRPWPRTPKGALRATKDDLDALDHPIAKAQRTIAEIDKITGYIEKVSKQAEVTGRCHPQVGTLAASSTGRMCIPTTHSILTSRGVLKWDDVRIGDWTLDMHGAWVQVTGVYKYDDQPTLIRTGKNLRLEATAEHRWVSRSEFGKLYVGPINETQRRSIHLAPLGGDFDIRGRAIDAVTDGERFAALVGMMITDGRCAESGNGLRGYVYQSEHKFYDEFMRVIPSEAVMYDKRRDLTDNGDHEIRLKTRWLRPRLEAAGLHPDPHLTDDPNLTSWVLGLTLRECAAFLRAGYLGDGIASTIQGQRMVAQRSAAREAFRVAAYRLGYRTHEIVKTETTGWGTDPQVSVWFCKRPSSTRVMSVTHGRADVWCVTTTSGTFTAWDNGPYLTGNSYSMPELQQFSRNARKVLLSDNPDAGKNCIVTELPNGKTTTELAGPDTQLWSIDWSQIEPITMGVMAKDFDFLAPYEAGADLYEPLMRAAGIVRDMAKVGLLADMYGQGELGMAKRLGLTIEQAGQIRRQIRAAMPMCTRWMAQVQGIADTYGKIVTASGRILPVDKGGIFKSVNYIVQGSAYDVLAHAICTIEREGMGDLIRLAMHDELVFDATADEAAELQQIMTTAPPFFTKWLGREPILRSDRAPMGKSWLKV